MTFWDALAVGSNLAAVYMLIAQHIRHRNYREKVHALLADEGFAEGEAAAIIEEALRMTAHLKMPEPKARDFAHGLLAQPTFRKAVAHEALHDIYIETHGRML